MIIVMIRMPLSRCLATSLQIVVDPIATKHAGLRVLNKNVHLYLHRSRYTSILPVTIILVPRGGQRRVRKVSHIN